MTCAYCRYALAVYFDGKAETVMSTVPWRAKYVFDDDIIRYVSIENYKSMLQGTGGIPIHSYFEAMTLTHSTNYNHLKRLEMTPH